MALNINFFKKNYGEEVKKISLLLFCTVLSGLWGEVIASAAGAGGPAGKVDSAVQTVNLYEDPAVKFFVGSAGCLIKVTDDSKELKPLGLFMAMCLDRSKGELSEFPFVFIDADGNDLCEFESEALEFRLESLTDGNWLLFVGQESLKVKTTSNFYEPGIVFCVGTRDYETALTAIRKASLGKIVQMTMQLPEIVKT